MWPFLCGSRCPHLIWRRVGFPCLGSALTLVFLYRPVSRSTTAHSQTFLMCGEVTCSTRHSNFSKDLWGRGLRHISTSPYPHCLPQTAQKSCAFTDMVLSCNNRFIRSPVLFTAHCHPHPPQPFSLWDARPRGSLLWRCRPEAVCIGLSSALLSCLLELLFLQLLRRSLAGCLLYKEQLMGLDGFSL